LTADRSRRPLTSRRPPAAAQNLIFRFLQSRQRVQVWLFDHADLRVEGRLVGFDEFMNFVLDEAEEVSAKRGTRKPLGRILLKGDNITLCRGL
jgi:small nuclear ribonucleoprotein E